MNVATGFKVPQFEELNFKKFMKFFISFLTRYNQAHLVLTTRKLEHIHDLNSSINPDAIMTQIQMRMVNKVKVRWRKQNKIAYSFLMEVCNFHPKLAQQPLSSKEMMPKDCYKHWKTDIKM